MYRPRDLLWRAEARQRRSGEDALALGGLELAILGPGDGAGRHRIHSDIGRELEGQRPRQRDQARLGDAVDEVALQRALGMDVGDVDDRAAALGELRRRLLGDEQRRAREAR